jgi:hypothetical protein
VKVAFSAFSGGCCLASYNVDEIIIVKIAKHQIKVDADPSELDTL